MKKFTVIFGVFLVLLFSSMLTYIAISPDFVAPVKIKNQSDLSEDNPIWNKSIDDLAAYLVEEGVLETADYDLLVDGIATEARLYSGVELYWWDLEHLEPEDELYEKYQCGLENGYVQWTSEYRIDVEVHGPFAVGYYGEYQGDADKLLEVFSSYCTKD